MLHKTCNCRLTILLNDHFNFYALPAIVGSRVVPGDIYVEKVDDGTPVFYCPQCTSEVALSDVLFECQETHEMIPASELVVDARGRLISKAASIKYNIKAKPAEVSL